MTQIIVKETEHRVIREQVQGPAGPPGSYGIGDGLELVAGTLIQVKIDGDGLSVSNDGVALDPALVQVAANITAFGLSMVSAADAAAGRTLLGLGGMALQDPAAVLITGGDVTGVTITNSTIDATVIGATSRALGYFTAIDVTLPSLFAQGSAAAPGIAFQSAATTGLYLASSNLNYSQAGVSKVRFNGGLLHVEAVGGLAWVSSTDAQTGTVDLTLLRDASNVMAQRNGVTAQAWRLYNTYTDGANYERLTASWAGNVLNLVTEQGGTGTARALQIGTTGLAGINFRVNNVNIWALSATDNALIPNSDNAYDIGRAALRPRRVYAAIDFVGPIGATTPAAGTFTTLSATGLLTALNGWFTGRSAPASGIGTEVFSDGTNAWVLGYNRTGANYIPLQLDGSSITFNTSTVARASVTATGFQGPIGATTPNSGAFTFVGSTAASFGIGHNSNAYGNGIWGNGANNVYIGQGQWLDASGATTTALSTTPAAYQMTSGAHRWYSNTGATVGASFAVAMRMQLTTTALHNYTDQFTLGASADVSLNRDAANALAQRNGANAQTSRVYNTYTDASNYERLTLTWSSNIALLLTESAGTGASRGLIVGTAGNNTTDIYSNGGIRWRFEQSGANYSLRPVADNANDIGISTNRPRDVYIGRNLFIGATAATFGASVTLSTSRAVTAAADDAGFYSYYTNTPASNSSAASHGGYVDAEFNAGTTVTQTSMNGLYVRVLSRGSGSGTLSTLTGVHSMLVQSTTTRTVADYAAFRAQTTSVTSGAVTAGHCFDAQNQSSANITTAIAFRGRMANAANRWNLYMDGTANNAIAGNVRIGSTVAPTVALDVTGALAVSGTGIFGGTLQSTAGNIQITSDTGIFSMGASVDVRLYRDESAALGLRNGVVPQAFRVYNTYTDASNHERGIVGWISNAFTVGTQNAGTGVARVLGFMVAGTERWQMGSTAFYTTIDNTYDFGTVSNRARTAYIATSVIIGAATTLTATGSTITGQLLVANNTASAGSNNLVVQNTQAGTGQFAALSIQSDLTRQIQIGMTSSTYTGSAVIGSSAGFLFTNQANGIAVITASGAFKVSDSLSVRQHEFVGTAYRAYNAYTDVSNYERGFARWNSNQFQIGTEAAGTGAARDVNVVATGAASVFLSTANTGRWQVNTSGHLLAFADNSYDLGASANRPRTGYFATSVIVQGPTGFVNGVTITSAATTAMPIIAATGSDTNIDLRLQAKGTGNIRFGTHSALAGETVTGYITIKDDGGTARKVAIVS